MCTKKGFTLIELSLAIFIVNITLILWLSLFNLLQNFDAKIDERENNLGLIQLRRVIALGHDFEIFSDELCMNYRDDMTCFYETNHRLIQTPGTQIYLLNISDCEFKEDGNTITLSYLFNDQVVETIIGVK